jgi:hypothetical protein
MPSVYGYALKIDEPVAGKYARAESTAELSTS